MPTIPDDPAYHHDHTALGALQSRYGDMWEIERNPGGLPVWTATHRSPDGRSLRYIVAHQADELARKLNVAGIVEP